MADTAAMADEIRSMGGHEFADPDDVHSTLTGMHEIVAACQETLARWGEQLGETGVHPAYADAAREAASSMTGIADELEEVTSGGVMHGPGG
jgi:hypothetical protein